MSEPVEVRHAATVVVVRGAGADAEVLLLRRGDTAGFMAGMFVYPGGRLDPADLDAADGDLDTAARWTALRECFEESGLLLATDQQGQPSVMLVCSSSTVRRMKPGEPSSVSSSKL